ncbi:hypothetical protein EW026_g8425, partial [Hermanssonia centrifuga]
MEIQSYLHAITSNIHVNTTSLFVVSTVIIVLAHVVPYLVDPAGLRAYPGPVWPRYLDSGWLGWPTMVTSILQFIMRTRNTVTYNIYYATRSPLTEPFPGTFVRISPVEVSILHSEALQQIYGHTSGTTKSDMYSAFAQFGGTLSVFTTRDFVEHTRKRKIKAHIMSLKSVVEFEPIMHSHQRILVKKWDR